MTIAYKRLNLAAEASYSHRPTAILKITRELYDYWRTDIPGG